MENQNHNQTTPASPDLIQCHRCGANLQKFTKVCPQCGAGQNVSEGKSKVIAGLLALFIGGLGIHRFYLGQVRGIFYILFWWTGIPSLISIVEAIIFFVVDQNSWDNKYNDGNPSVTSSTAVLLTVILVFFAIMVGTGILGILAAIAIPSYVQYQTRAQVYEATAMTANYRTFVAVHHLDHGSFNDITTADIDAPRSGQYVANIDLQVVSADQIIVVATFDNNNANAQIRGKEFRYASVDGGQTWACGDQIDQPELKGDNMIDSRFMPPACK